LEWLPKVQEKIKNKKKELNSTLENLGDDMPSTIQA
jgi:hypothetical protein